MMWERVIGGIASAAEASGTNGGGGKDAMDEMAICGTEPGVQVGVRGVKSSQVVCCQSTEGAKAAVHVHVHVE